MTKLSLLRATLALGALSLLGMALAAPWALSQFPLLLAGLSAAFGPICHQEPSRALLVEGLPSLLCARCLGALAGGSAALLVPARLSKSWVLKLLAARAPRRGCWRRLGGLGRPRPGCWPVRRSG